MNGSQGVARPLKSAELGEPRVPKIDANAARPRGTRDLLLAEGPEAVAKWVRAQKKLLFTDTTMRDAHQSLLATRVRTHDLLKIAPATSHYGAGFFSLEMWGGATFDVAMRFLKEDPWDRLVKLRQAIPNVLFQMLLRGSNAVGYTNYADNVVQRFVEEAAKNGIDVFRVFDALNWTKGMAVAMEAVRKQNKILEAAVCYTGDITDPKRDKYPLTYYVKLAKELESMGAHFLGIKDMAGLLKPFAARKLVKALKQEVGLPIHLHTHDTSGIASATLLEAAQAGVDVVDAALSSLSGLTAQPNLNSLVAALKGTEWDSHLEEDGLQLLANYWETVREYYAPFESGLKSGTAEVYRHEIPGGQYSNYRPQVIGLGLVDKWEECKDMYRKVNLLFGDVIKVTPSSKVVGDMAMFLVKNGLEPEDLFTEKGKDLAFPESVIGFARGMLGQLHGGFPAELQKIILREVEPITSRPGELIEPVDFDAETQEGGGADRPPDRRQGARLVPALPERLPRPRPAQGRVLGHVGHPDAGLPLRPRAGAGDLDRHRARQDAHREAQHHREAASRRDARPLLRAERRRALGHDPRPGGGDHQRDAAEGRQGQPAPRRRADAGQGRQGRGQAGRQGRRRRAS